MPPSAQFSSFSLDKNKCSSPARPKERTNDVEREREVIFLHHQLWTPLSSDDDDLTRRGTRFKWRRWRTRSDQKSPFPIRIKPRTKPAIYERHCRAQPMEHVAVIAHTVRTSEPSSMRKMANQREGKWFDGGRLRSMDADDDDNEWMTIWSLEERERASNLEGIVVGSKCILI